MKSILHELYIGNLDELYAILDKKLMGSAKDEENKTYDKLYATLTEEQKQLLDTFLDLLSGRYADIEEYRYIKGFKTGLLIAVECFDFKP